MTSTIHEILPPELIEHILSICDPLEVAAFGQTSRFFRTLVYQTTDQHLWRSLYLSQPFDDPRSCVSFLGRPRPAVDWKSELQHIIRTRSVIENTAICRSDERCTVLQTLLNMACNVPSSPHAFSSDSSQNLLWVAAVLRGGTFLHHDEWTLSAEEQQLRARLHTYFGLTPIETQISSGLRTKSRAYVYDLRHYSWLNHFGPFHMDGSGRVNWIHMRAIHHVVSMHVVDLGDNEEFVFTVFPMSLPFCQPIIPEGMDLDQEQDWAGVAGYWSCTYCFIPHDLLLVYNDSSDGLDLSIFDDPEFDEVFQALPDVQFYVTSTEHDPAHPTHPKINFAGELNERYTMRGYVNLTPDDQIRWHFTSGENDQMVWSSEGVQVGGVRSPFGVLGAWSTVLHDELDPVGPFWLRRVYHSEN